MPAQPQWTLSEPRPTLSAQSAEVITPAFFPSVRKYIINYISIGPEDKGEGMPLSPRRKSTTDPPRSPETLAGSCVKILGFLVPWCKPAIYQYKSVGGCPLSHGETFR